MPLKRYGHACYLNSQFTIHIITDLEKLLLSNACSLYVFTFFVSKVKANAKTSQKGKISAKTVKERDISSSSYLHACEILLSLIVDRKKQDTNAIISLKKSGPQITELLTRFSASIAGAGVAVVLSVVCQVVCNRVPFCKAKLLSTGFGLGLVWISLAVNNLRNTVVSIRRSSGRLDGEDEEMVDRMDGNLKDVWFRAAAVLTVAVLRLA